MVAKEWLADYPTPLLVAEIGVNHLGSGAIAVELAALARAAGFDMVKLQLRTPELNLAHEGEGKRRRTPWGDIDELAYRKRMELTDFELDAFAAYCREADIPWTASCWDAPAVDRLMAYEPPMIKVPSARLLNRSLLERVASTGLPVIASTGMASLAEVAQAVERLGRAKVLLAHTVSAYPCPLEHLNLAGITTLQSAFPHNPIGYSGHEGELWPSYIALALGARFVERHITLSRDIFGADERASLEPHDFAEFCRNARRAPSIMGSGERDIGCRRGSDCAPAQKERRRRVSSSGRLLKFSYWPSPYGRPRDVSRLVSQSLNDGFAAAYMSDHVIPPRGPRNRPILELWSLLAHIATLTPSIGVGSLVSCAAFRPALLTYRAAATVALMSDHPVRICVGACWFYRGLRRCGNSLRLV